MGHKIKAPSLIQIAYLIPIVILVHYSKDALMKHLFNHHHRGDLEIVHAPNEPDNCKCPFYHDVTVLQIEMRVLQDKILEMEASRQDLVQTLNEKIERSLDDFQSDQIGLFDYASEYAGGSVVSTPNTYPYPSPHGYKILGSISWIVPSRPNVMLQPSNTPGECFAYYGDKGQVVIKLAQPVKVAHVSLEHIKLGDQRNAPRDFQVWGLSDEKGAPNGFLLGNFTYNSEGRVVQTFQVGDVRLFQLVELRILSNYGNVDYTCVYRFRVHSIS